MEVIVDCNVDKKRVSFGVMLKIFDKFLLIWSFLDNIIVIKLDWNLLECDGLLKVKFVLSDME